MPESAAPDNGRATSAAVAAHSLPEGRIASWRSQVDEALAGVWTAAAGKAGVDALYPFIEALNYALLGPGKRIRPVLVLATGACCGGSDEELLDGAIAVELIHAYSLVHDDLPSMDDDDLRRGRATTHRVYGEDVAILVGDALQTMAFQRLAECRHADDVTQIRRRLGAISVLARAAGWNGMVGGQYLDVVADETGTTDGAGQHAAQHAAQLRALEQIHTRKTGDLLAASAHIGAVLAGADANMCANARRYGAQLGLLFQIVDDLLDEVGSAEITGKTSGSDRRANKATAVSLLSVDGAGARADDVLAQCLEYAEAMCGDTSVLAHIARFARHRVR